MQRQDGFGSTSGDAAMTAGFRRRRLVARIVFLFGLFLTLAAGADGTEDALAGTVTKVARWAGILLMVAVFPLYLLTCNSCPRCRRSFSGSPGHAGSDTDGLPLFNRIPACPSCGLELDGCGLQGSDASGSA